MYLNFNNLEKEMEATAEYKPIHGQFSQKTDKIKGSCLVGTFFVAITFY